MKNLTVDAEEKCVSTSSKTCNYNKSESSPSDEDLTICECSCNKGFYQTEDGCILSRIFLINSCMVVVLIVFNMF